MPKPRHNPEERHTQEKLRVFSGYLDRYLTILLALPYVKRVDIFDMLAGQGMYGSAAGSAMRAFETVKKHRQKQPGKDVHLHLNEGVYEKFRTLREHIQPDSPENRGWVKCSQQDVNAIVAERLSEVPSNAYKLFYLDPFGYTQIKKRTLDCIVSAPRAECLLFVPVTRFAQFFRKGVAENEQLKPIKKFCEEYNIDPLLHQNVKWRDWGRVIRNAFVRTYGQGPSDPYVGIAYLGTEGANYYALYFFGQHAKGMEKFMEVVNQFENPQPDLFPPENKEALAYLSEKRTNCDIYEWALQEGWAPKNCRAFLFDLEKRGKITVHSTGKRRPGDFYLSYEHSRQPKIVVELNRDGN